MIKVYLIFSVILFSFNGSSQQLDSDRMSAYHLPLDGAEVEMIPYRTGNLYGFVAPNKPDVLLINSTYEMVLSVNAEGAIVCKREGFGLVNLKNEVIIPFEYDWLKKEGDFYHGLIRGGEDNAYRFNHFFYTMDGDLVFSQESNNEVYFGYNNYAWFDYQSAVIIKDKNGFVVSRFPKLKRELCLGIHNNYTCFRKKINKSYVYSAYTHLGDLAFEIPIATIPWFKGVIQLDEDLFMFESSPNNRVFSNQNGEFMPYRARLSNYELNESSIVERGSIRVGQSDKGVMGVVNLKGDTLIPFEYSRIYTKVNNRYIAIEKKSKKMVVLDQNGRKLSEIDQSKIDFIQQRLVLNNPIAFFDGLAIARKPVTKIGSFTLEENADSARYFFAYFDQKGETVIHLNSKYTFVTNFSEGLAAISDSLGNLGFINTKGELIIEPQFKFEIPKYGLAENEIPKFKGGFAYIESVKGYIDKNGLKYYTD